MPGEKRALDSESQTQGANKARVAEEPEPAGAGGAGGFLQELGRRNTARAGHGTARASGGAGSGAAAAATDAADARSAVQAHMADCLSGDWEGKLRRSSGGGGGGGGGGSGSGSSSSMGKCVDAWGPGSTDHRTIQGQALPKVPAQ
jgi:hypothetical protein